MMKLQSMKRPHNFGAGPAQLPEAVLAQIAADIPVWHDGMSVMEYGHRTPRFMELAERSTARLRSLLAIPDDFEILFMHGGARGQFAAIPMNFLLPKTVAGYYQTGTWSKLAAEEAKRFGEIETFGAAGPETSTAYAYVHYTDNETIDGVEFPEPPQLGRGMLVSDMTSNILTRTIDWQHYGAVYAGAQKTLGIAGITVAIIRKSWLVKAEENAAIKAGIPSILNYPLWAESQSLYNTPSIFAWYVTDLVLAWAEKMGGVAYFEKEANHRAERLYEQIASSSFYQNTIDKLFRSRINIPFRIHDSKLEPLFLSEAESAGLVQLKGHKVVGGLRASFYTAMTEEGVTALIQFMRDFETKYG